MMERLFVKKQLIFMRASSSSALAALGTRVGNFTMAGSLQAAKTDGKAQRGTDSDDVGPGLR